MPLVITLDTREFFRDALSEVRRRQRLAVQPETEFYLVDLLAGGDALTDVPMAMLLQAALESRGAERAGFLRRMGDGSLYRAGFFSDSLVSKPVDQKYYVAMGARAYEALSEMRDMARLRQVYAELAEKFQRLVELLAELYERTVCHGPDGLLKLYERYLRNDSDRLKWYLQARGLLINVGSEPQ